METINKYLESLFSTLPKTAEVLRLHEDMTAHMEEKYNELKSSGKTENEAIGIVISEFGSIEEIAAEMNISLSSNDLTDAISFEVEEVENFLALNNKSNIIVAVGVFLCLLGVVSLIGISTVATQSSVLGIVVLLVFVAVAVGLFIFAESLVEPFAFLEKTDKPFFLTFAARSWVEATKERARSKQLVGTIAGISGILLGVIFLLVFSTFSRNNNSVWGVIVLLVLVGLSTATFIITSSAPEACDKLLESGDFSRGNKRNSNVIGAVAAIWWPLSTVVFLLWSFLGPRGFGISWIVWPISGILFGAFSAVYNILSGNRQG